MTVQSYTVTSVAATQPASNSYALEIDNPKIKVSGLAGSEFIDIRISMDGSDPDASDVAEQIRENGVFQLTAKTGNKVVFVGYNISSNVTIEVENS